MPAQAPVVLHLIMTVWSDPFGWKLATRAEEAVASPPKETQGMLKLELQLLAIVLTK